MSETISNPAYRIETKRLVVRCYQPSDAQLLAESVTESVEHLKRFMSWAYAEPEPIEKKEERLKRARDNFDLQKDYTYGIFNAKESKLIGSTGLHTRLGDNQLEVGYWIHKDFLNQGFVTESTAALIKVAFEIIKVHRVEIHCASENLASAAIPRKLGFTHEGTLREKLPNIIQWDDMMIWGLLESEYPNSPAFKAQIKVFDATGNALL